VVKALPVIKAMAPGRGRFLLREPLADTSDRFSFTKSPDRGDGAQSPMPILFAVGLHKQSQKYRPRGSD
jgi:hypothetical protein